MKRACVVIAAAAVAALLPVGGAPLPGGAEAAFAQAATPSAVFDKKEISWRSIKDKSKSDFKGELASYKTQGFIPVDIDLEENSDEGFLGGATLQYDSDRDWDVRFDLSPSDFAGAVDLMRSKGYRLVDQDHYSSGYGNHAFGGLFIKNLEDLDWYAQRDLTLSQAADAVEDAKKKDFMAIDVDAYSMRGTLRYGLVFVHNAENLSWEIELSMQGENKFKEAGELHGSQHRMVAFDAIAHAQPVMTYAAIWVENVSGRGWWMNWDNFDKKYRNRWYRLADEGYRLIGYDRYQSWEGTRYAGIWRQNSTQPNWKHREDVDELLSDVRKATKVPGISAAVIQDGEVKYLRGEGYAHINPNEDKEQWTWLDSQHVIRTASVAKAVAGTLYMQLRQENEITGQESTKSLVPDMPDHHSHQLWQLITNRGCVRQTGELSDLGFEDDGPYASASAAAEEFWNDQLIEDCDPTQGFPNLGYIDHYSTPGYTLAGSAFEFAVGTDINQIITDRITDAHDLPTLRPLDVGDTTVRRSSMWEADGSGDDLENKPLDQYDSSWKVLGGGMETSVLDLVRFGHKLVSGQILDEDHLKEMWNLPDSATDDNGKPSIYAYGWDTGTDSGHPVVAKRGGQPGAQSYIRIYPDDNVVIAVMSNRWQGGHNTRQVAKTIGAKIIADIDGGP